MKLLFKQAEWTWRYMLCYFSCQSYWGAHERSGTSCIMVLKI